MSGDPVEQGTRMCFSSNAGEPFGPFVDDVGDVAQSFDIVDGGGPPPETVLCREGWFDPGISPLPFERFKHCSLFTADIGPRTGIGVKVDTESASENILAYKSLLVGVCQSFVQHPDPVDILSPDVDIDRGALHGVGSNQCTFNEEMRVIFKDHAVLAGTRFCFITMAGQIAWRAVRFRHERPLQSGIDPCSATAPDVGGLDLINDRFLCPIVTEDLSECLISSVFDIDIDLVNVLDFRNQYRFVGSPVNSHNQFSCEFTLRIFMGSYSGTVPCLKSSISRSICSAVRWFT